MLGVDEDSLTGRDAEEIGIELVDTLEESAAARDIQVSESVGVPSRGRNRANAIGAVSQHFPERAGAIRAREPAADPDDGDRLGTMADDDFRCLAGVSRQGLVREKSRERVDRGIIIGKRRGELAAEPLLQVGREPHGLQRADAETRERPSQVDLRGPHAERRSDLGGQPGGNGVSRGRTGLHFGSFIAAIGLSCLHRRRVPARQSVFRARAPEHPAGSTSRRPRALRPGTPPGRRGAGPSRSMFSGGSAS